MNSYLYCATWVCLFVPCMHLQAEEKNDKLFSVADSSLTERAKSEEPPTMVQKDRNLFSAVSWQTTLLLPTSRQTSSEAKLLGNTYLDFQLNGSFFELGARAEYMPYPLPGYENTFAGKGVPYTYAKLKSKTTQLTLGSFYETFGTGYILRSYENRDLGIDNHLSGLHLEYRPSKALQLKALRGRQRNYWQRNAAKITGLDLVYQLSEHLAQWHKLGQNLSLGLSWVNKHEAEEDILVDETHKLRLPQYVNAFDIRLHYNSRHWDWHAEYAYKTQDPSLDNNYIYRNGEVLLLSTSYARKDFSWLLQTQRSVNMHFRSARSGQGLAGQLNYFPPFLGEHSYRLARLYPYATQWQGEWAWQSLMGYNFMKNSVLGGKYGTKVKLGFSHIRDIARHGQSQRGTEGYQASWGEWGKELFYQELHLSVEKRMSKTAQLNLMFLYQENNRRLLDGKEGQLQRQVFVLETQYRPHRNWNWRGELQYLAASGLDSDWAFYLVECNSKSRWSFGGQHLFTTTGKGQHYYQVQVGYRHKSAQWRLSYGRHREGYDCSGGVCRYVPAYEGLSCSCWYNF